MDRLYLMPLVDTTYRGAPARFPKYADTLRASGIDYRAMDYGREPVCLVRAPNIDATTHAALVADTTVAAFPADLTQSVGAQLANVRQALEDRNIPGGQLVQAGTTYRQIVRAIIIIFQLAQRLDGLGFRLFGSGVTLDTTYSALPQAMKTALVQMATDFNFETSAITGASTLRQILKAMFDQWPASDVFLGGTF